MNDENNQWQLISHFYSMLLENYVAKWCAKLALFRTLHT